MYGLQVVAFGFDCPDPASPKLVQTIAAIVTFVVLGGICWAVVLASRSLKPAWLKDGLIAVSVVIALLASPFTYGLLALTLACGGLGL